MEQATSISMRCVWADRFISSACGEAEFAPALAWSNPFTSRLTIDFSLAVAAPVHMEVYDVAGRRVRISPTSVLAPGRHSLTWDGHADDGSLQTGGIYFVRVLGSGIEASRRVVRMN
jgi:flagellar hook assembly protein FlgD